MASIEHLGVSFFLSFLRYFHSLGLTLPSNGLDSDVLPSRILNFNHSNTLEQVQRFFFGSLFVFSELSILSSTIISFLHH